MSLPEIKVALTVTETKALLALLYVLDEAGEAVGISKDEGVVAAIAEKLLQDVLDTESEEIMTKILPAGFDAEMWKRDEKVH